MKHPEVKSLPVNPSSNEAIRLEQVDIPAPNDKPSIGDPTDLRRYSFVYDATSDLPKPGESAEPEDTNQDELDKLLSGLVDLPMTLIRNVYWESSFDKELTKLLQVEIYRGANLLKVFDQSFSIQTNAIAESAAYRIEAGQRPHLYWKDLAWNGFFQENKNTRDLRIVLRFKK